MTGEAAQKSSGADREPPGFAQACAEARSQASDSRRPVLVGGSVFALFLFSGAVLTFATGASLSFLFCLISGVFAALLVSFLVRIRERSRAWNRVRRTFQEALGRFRPDARKALFSQIDNVLLLVPLLKEDAAYLTEVTGETIDHLVTMARLIPDWVLDEGETHARIRAVEDDARAAEALFIHLQEGLIADADRVASSHEELSALIASTEGKAFFIESALATQRSALEELHECVGYLRRIVGASRKTIKTETEHFQVRRRALRGEAFGVMRHFLAQRRDSST